MNNCLSKLVLGMVAFAPGAWAQDHSTWRDYGGAADSAQYSALQQINRQNVSKLEVAWVYPTGDDRKYFFNPTVIDGVMYVLAKGNSIVALEASTGKEIWTYQPDTDTKIITNRGINYWESKDRTERRLLFASNHFLRALDARTGKLIASFGASGAVDLKEGLGRDTKTLTLVQSITWVGNEPGIRIGTRRPARLRRAHGQGDLDLPHHSPPRGVRL